jgi:hypothetical protein
VEEATKHAAIHQMGGLVGIVYCYLTALGDGGNTNLQFVIHLLLTFYLPKVFRQEAGTIRGWLVSVAGHSLYNAAVVYSMSPFQIFQFCLSMPLARDVIRLFAKWSHISITDPMDVLQEMHNARTGFSDTVRDYANGPQLSLPSSRISGLEGAYDKIVSGSEPHPVFAYSSAVVIITLIGFSLAVWMFQRKRRGRRGASSETAKCEDQTLNHVMTHGISTQLGSTCGSICTAWLPVQDIRPGANLIVCKALGPLVRADTRKCCSSGYYVAGPVMSRYVVTCYAGCTHNILRAMTSRMAGVPKAYVDSDDYAENLLAKEERVVEIWSRARAWLVMNMGRPGPFVRNRKDALTPSEWVLRFPEHKREPILHDYAIRLGTSIYDSFVKKEKTVLPTTLAHVDSYPSEIWIGNRPINTTRKLDPRGISVPSVTARATHGPICSAINNMLCEGFNSQLMYAPGLSRTQLTDWFIWAHEQLSTGALPWCMIIQGDDTCIFYADMTFASSDISRFDQSITVNMQVQTKLTQRTLLAISRRFCGEEEWEMFASRHSVLKKVGECRHRQTEQITYKAQGHKLEVEGTQASGASDTISNNSMNVFPAALSSLENGTDLDETFKSVGLLAGTHRGQFYLGNLDIEFLQLRIYKCAGERDYMVGSRIGRVLFRSFWCDTKLNERKLKSYALGVARGLLCDNRHVPCINDICARVIQLCEEEGLHEYKSREQVARESVLEFLANESTTTDIAEHDDTEEDVAVQLGVELTYLQSYRVYLRSWAWGYPLDPPEHQLVVDALYRLDCM